MLVLIAGAAFFAVKKTDPSVYANNIINEFSKKTGGAITYQSLELSIFPRPCLFAKGISFNLPAKVGAQIGYLKIYPKILPLLWTKLRISKIQVDSLRAIINIKDLAWKNKKDAGFEEIMQYVEKATAISSLDLAGLKIEIKNSDIRIIGEDNPVLFKCGFFEAGFFASKKKIQVNLGKIIMDEPHAVITGKFNLDKAGKEAVVEIKGAELSVGPVRKTALALAGRFKTTKKIFEILIDGEVPHISLSSKANSIKTLFKPENIQIIGRLNKGKIIIPTPFLNIEDVHGDVTVLRGTLEGKNLTGKMGGSYAEDGKLSTGIMGGKAPFYLETKIKADLADLPDILKRVIKSESVKRELSLIRNCSGRASGTLILDNQRQRPLMEPRVDVTDFTLSTDYARFPFPIKLAGGGFLYQQKQINIENITGAFGRSTCSNLSAEFAWQDVPSIALKAESSRLFSNEAYPWFMSLKKSHRSYFILDSVDGEIELSGININGPFLHPDEWIVKTRGKTDEIKILAGKFFDGPVMAKGMFDATNEELSFTDAAFGFSDAVIKANGILSGYLKNMSAAKISLTGDMGPKSLKWLSGISKQSIKLNPDASIKISKGEIVWIPEEITSFTGQMTFLNGPDISIEAIRKMDSFAIKSLKIKDRDSDVELAFLKKDDAYEADFKGTLAHSSIKQMLSIDQPVPGAINGDFHLIFVKNKSDASSIDGIFDIYDFAMPEKINFPSKIEKAYFKAEGKKCRITADMITENEDRLKVEGDLSAAGKDFFFDLNVAANGLKLDQIIKNIEKDKEKKHEAKRTKFWDYPVRGKLNVNAGPVKYSGFIFSTASADIFFNPEEIIVNIINSDLCGIKAPGTIRLKPGNIKVDFNPFAAGQKLETAFPCLTGKKGLIQGDVDLTGNIIADG
jgi:hypothetical protein